MDESIKSVGSVESTSNGSTVDESLVRQPLEEFEPASPAVTSPEGEEMGNVSGRRMRAETSGPVPGKSVRSDEYGLGMDGAATEGVDAVEFDVPAEASKPQSGEAGAMRGGEVAEKGKLLPMAEQIILRATQSKDAPDVEQLQKGLKDAEVAEQNDFMDLKRQRFAGEAKKEAPPAPAAEPAARVASNPVPSSNRSLTRQSEMQVEPGWIQNSDPTIGGLADTPQDQPGQGLGPGEGGDKFEPIEENDFIAVADQPLSTFSIDVDTASYSKIRSYLSQFNSLPPRDAVRVEELVNYFTYDYATPTDEHPFAANVEVASCPWNPTNRLVRVGIKGKEINTEERPASNLVFLLDVSGSMNQPNKLPLLKKGMKMLVDQLTENDKVSIVVYAGAAGMVLEPTYGYEKANILKALDRLQAGGSTNGGQGIKLAYKTATENFIQGGTNRVILCTDGDFNVGETSTGGLVGMAAEQAKKNIYLSVMGFGIGNHNDSMLEQLSNKANGNYSFIDNEKEAKKVLVEQMSGTLLTIAKDVKIQIEFNPKKVASYRLVGYENRLLAAQDFNDDKKDAGEIGAGHTVTAFYEVVPAAGNGESEVASVDPKVDELKYQTKPETTEAADSNELMTLKLRYKQPEEDVSTLMTYPVVDAGHQFNKASGDFQFATAVAMFGLKLRGSHFHNETNFAEIEELVASNVDGPGSSYREEFLEMVRKVEGLQK